MFAAKGQAVRRARGQIGNLTPLAIPSKGMNARDAFALMGPDSAIALENVVVENYGLRTRKGYTEWARNVSLASPVSTVMSYYPATAAPAALALAPFPFSNLMKMLVQPRAPATPPAGKLFAAANGNIYDVTAGGVGPWVAQVGVVAPAAIQNFWTWINFQNIAGSFLTITNDAGGYSYYNGVAWATPVAGTGVGQIDGANPANFVFVMSHKKRLWFIEKNTTASWYLPVSQITGQVKRFDFGEQFRHGGRLAALASFTADGGVGPDDYLVAISSQGDVVVYKGVDPDSPSDWSLVGVWYVGALPVGRRMFVNTGADIHILSQYGVTPLSLLLAAPKELGGLEQRRTSYLISPLIAQLMRQFSSLPGWSITSLPTEELLLVKVPELATGFGGQYFALRVLSGAWSVLKDLPYADIVSIDSAAFAGTIDGRVVRAFDGALDNVLIGEVTGKPIQCVVTPSFQAMGASGNQKVFKLIRPTFITTRTPAVVVQIMVDYGPPKDGFTPSLPIIPESLWDVGLWDSALWTGIQSPIKEWVGCTGVGFVGTAQLTYKCGGDTMLAAIDFWTEQGGVM